jgi:hypothetical protein
MERLYFQCPSTRREVDVGIESELGTLLRLRASKVCAACPFCGERHEWAVSDARIARPGWGQRFGTPPEMGSRPIGR